MALADPGAEWVLPPAISAESCTGIDAIRAFWTELADLFEEIRVERRWMLEIDGSTLSELAIEATGATSGLRVATRMHTLTRFRDDGRWHRVELFQDRADLLEAVAATGSVPPRRRNPG